MKFLWTTILLGASFGLLTCAKSPDYLRSTEHRLVCHKKFRNAEWYPVQLDIPLWLAYDKHIGMHPNDYWGRCKEEIVPIPPLGGQSDWLKEFNEKLRGRRQK